MLAGGVGCSAGRAHPAASRVSTRQPLPALVHRRRRDPRTATSRRACSQSGGALAALRPLARVADPRPTRSATPSARGDARRRCSRSPTSYLGPHARRHCDSLVEANSVISCVDRPTEAAPTTARELADVAAVPGRAARRGAASGRPRAVRRACPSRRRATSSATCRCAGTPPILVIGTTGDPATPYAGAEAMAGADRRAPASSRSRAPSTPRSAPRAARCIDDAVDALPRRRRDARARHPLRPLARTGACFRS